MLEHLEVIKETLQSILKNQGADVEADQKRLEDLLGQVKYQKDIESKGLDMVKIPFIPTLIVWWHNDR